MADGYIANYQEVLNALPLILVTSNWVKEMYVRDGIDGDKIEVLPVVVIQMLLYPSKRTIRRLWQCVKPWVFHLIRS